MEPDLRQNRQIAFPVVLHGRKRVLRPDCGRPMLMVIMMVMMMMMVMIIIIIITIMIIIITCDRDLY